MRRARERVARFTHRTHLVQYEENMYAEIARTPLEHTSTRAAILRIVSYALPQRATHFSDGALVSHSWPPHSQGMPRRDS